MDNKCFQFECVGLDWMIGVGFAGNILIILNMLYFYQNNNIYIDMFTKGKSIVHDISYSLDFNLNNSFDYYFDQKCNINSNLIPFKHNNVILQYNCIELSDINKIIKDLFYANYSLKENLLNEINLFYENNFKNFIILGINIRLTDMVYHHNTNNIDYFLEKTNQILNNIKIDKIFIATDNMEAINIFINTFKNVEILYQKNICRENIINSIRGPHERINTDNITINNRKYHNYLTGKEVLIDIFLLTKCNYLIKSKSSVSYVAIVLNENIKQVF